MKPGYKTTQFWLILLLAVLPALQQLLQAVLHALPPADAAAPASAAGLLAGPALGWLGPALAVIFYTLARETSYRHFLDLVVGRTTGPDAAARPSAN